MTPLNDLKDKLDRFLALYALDLAHLFFAAKKFMLVSYVLTPGSSSSQQDARNFLTLAFLEEIEKSVDAEPSLSAASLDQNPESLSHGSVSIRNDVCDDFKEQSPCENPETVAADDDEAFGDDTQEWSHPFVDHVAFSAQDSASASASGAPVESAARFSPSPMPVCSPEPQAALVSTHFNDHAIGPLGCPVPTVSQTPISPMPVDVPQGQPPGFSSRFNDGFIASLWRSSECAPQSTMGASLTTAHTIQSVVSSVSLLMGHLSEQRTQRQPNPQGFSAFSSGV